MSTQLGQIGLEGPAFTPARDAAERRAATASWLMPVGEATVIAAIALWELADAAGFVARLVGAVVFAVAFATASRGFRGIGWRSLGLASSGFEVVLGSLAAAIVTAAAAFLAPSLGIDSGPLAVTVLLTAVVGFGWKLAVASREPVQRILLVAGGSGTGELIAAVTGTRSSRFEIAGIVADGPLEGLSPHVHHRRLSDLAEAVQNLRPDLVVVAVDRGRPEVFAHLVEVAESGFRVVGLPEFFEHAFGRVPVRHVGPAWFMSVLHLYQRPYPRVAKRMFDVGIALLSLLLVLPLLPAIGLLVACSGRPIIFRQTRLGENGRHFTIFKFRTMRQNAEAGGAVWASADDARVTVVGRILRRTRLDELPQIWNVLRGDMSIVGPRPERPEFLPLLESSVPFWTSRHLLKPGITGWAQISSGYSDDELGTIDKLSYDLWYLRHRSVLVDLMICLRTLPYFFTGEGAR